jgi:hypothetical protein
MSPTKVQRRVRHAAEQKRWRHNSRVGIKIARAPHDAVVLDFMIAMKWLDPKRADDPAAIGQAYFALVRKAAPLKNSERSTRGRRNPWQALDPDHARRHPMNYQRGIPLRADPHCDRSQRPPCTSAAMPESARSRNIPGPRIAPSSNG